ncbi:hypothetical protein [Sporolactobacillus sp. CQH2019]|uniref:hypothetical protein n=1 Tax=Sporolactobacillus sp. CQH2019 TaxID=3023512 RepID=UPI002367DAC7|nr:hypothetical protein [Sporolactobacillus sp. CQH2019]
MDFLFQAAPRESNEKATNVLGRIDAPICLNKGRAGRTKGRSPFRQAGSGEHKEQGQIFHTMTKNSASVKLTVSLFHVSLTKKGNVGSIFILLRNRFSNKKGR